MYSVEPNKEEKLPACPHCQTELAEVKFDTFEAYLKGMMGGAQSLVQLSCPKCGKTISMYVREG